MLKFVVVVMLSQYSANSIRTYEVYFQDQAACEQHADEVTKKIKREIYGDSLVYCVAKGGE